MSSQRTFRFGVVASQLPSTEEWVARAQLAERLGYSTFVMPDTVGRTPSPMTALAFAAAATRTLRVGPYVLANDFRSPVLLARECATLDFLSNGRFELGLGAGRPNAEPDYRKVGIPLDPGGVRVERLAEALGIVKSLLAGQRVSVTGRHYTVTDAEVFPLPAQKPRPPILVAGSGKRMLALAAREADIIAIGGSPVESEAAIKEKVDGIRQAAGDRFDQVELNVNLMAVGQQAHPQALAYLGITAEQLIGSNSPVVLMGTTEEMCDRLLARRETLSISYVLVAESFMETFAPVVERLAGR
jgi:probable F420-dependent oxidoreductase